MDTQPQSKPIGIEAFVCDFAQALSNNPGTELSRVNVQQPQHGVLAVVCVLNTTQVLEYKYGWSFPFSPAIAHWIANLVQQSASKIRSEFLDLVDRQYPGGALH